MLLISGRSRIRTLESLTPSLELFPSMVHSLRERGRDGKTEGEGEGERENEGLSKGCISIYCTILETFL